MTKRTIQQISRWYPLTHRGSRFKPDYGNGKPVIL